MNFYTVSNKHMPWGDYGNILLEGNAYEIDDAVTGIDRTGPFIPPVVVSSRKLIVTDQTKKKLESYGLKGIQYKTCLKQKVVNIPWHTWPETHEPAVYPAGGEPENYIDKRKHNEKIAAQMPDLWELCINDNETLLGRIQKNGDQKVDLFLIEKTWTGKEIFRSKSHSGYIFVTEDGRTALEEQSEGFLIFDKFSSREGTTEEIKKAEDFLKQWWEKEPEKPEASFEAIKIRNDLLKKASKSVRDAPKAKTDQGTASRYSVAYNALRKAHAIKPLAGDDVEKLKIVLRFFKYI